MSKSTAFPILLDAGIGVVVGLVTSSWVLALAAAAAGALAMGASWLGSTLSFAADDDDRDDLPARSLDGDGGRARGLRFGDADHEGCEDREVVGPAARDERTPRVGTH